MRDLGSALQHVRAWKERDTLGSFAPRLVAAGPIVMGLTTDAEPRVVPVRTAGEGQRVVDSLGKSGVDLIKVYDWVPLNAYCAVARCWSRPAA